jgi:hypothetical protein
MKSTKGCLSTLSAYLTALGVGAQLVVEVGGQTMTYDRPHGGDWGTMTTQTEITQRNHHRAEGAPSGFRTPDPLIKSQLLYQLS